MVMHVDPESAQLERIVQHELSDRELREVSAGLVMACVFLIPMASGTLPACVKIPEGLL